jgi:hypothetical protein
VEQELAFGRDEVRAAEFVEEDEGLRGEIAGHLLRPLLALAAGSGPGLQLVDEAEHIGEPPSCAATDGGTRDGGAQGGGGIADLANLDRGILKHLYSGTFIPSINLASFAEAFVRSSCAIGFGAAKARNTQAEARSFLKKFF